MSKKKFAVLDVEGMSSCRPYNIGYIIGDNEGNITASASMSIMSCIWENLQRCGTAKEMTHRNIEEILNDFDNKEKKYEVFSLENAKKKILNDLIKHDVKEIWAYNAQFDKASLIRLFGEDSAMLTNLVQFYDIIPAIVHTKLLNKKYVNWCIKNNYITEKGNIMTKAEIVYKYLKNDLTFEEEHTGLSDCKIEYEILLTAMRTKKKINKEESRPAWRVFKEFCALNSIEIPV